MRSSAAVDRLCLQTAFEVGCKANTSPLVSAPGVLHIFKRGLVRTDGYPASVDIGLFVATDAHNSFGKMDIRLQSPGIVFSTDAHYSECTTFECLCCKLCVLLFLLHYIFSYVPCTRH